MFSKMCHIRFFLTDAESLTTRFFFVFIFGAKFLPPSIVCEILVNGSCWLNKSHGNFNGNVVNKKKSSLKTQT